MVRLLFSSLVGGGFGVAFRGVRDRRGENVHDRATTRRVGELQVRFWLPRWFRFRRGRGLGDRATRRARRCRLPRQRVGHVITATLVGKRRQPRLEGRRHVLGRGGPLGEVLAELEEGRLFLVGVRNSVRDQNERGRVGTR